MPAWPDDRYPGKYLGRHEYRVDETSIAAYTAGTGDAHSWYTGASPWGGPVAPALILHSEQYAFPLRDWYLPNLYGNLHIRQEWELFRAVPVGSQLWTHGLITDRYPRKDRDVVVLEFTVFDQADVIVARGRCHQSFLRDATDALVVERGQQRPPSANGALASEPIELLQPLTKRVDMDRCMAFSGPNRNYHNDADEARKLGFPDIVVQGTMSTTFISELLTRRFGSGWFEGGRMSLNLVNVLWGGESVSVHGAIREWRPEGSRRRALLDVWTQKPDGTKTIAGTASALEV